MTSFTQNLAKLMPDWVTLPPELIETFDWLEKQGWYHIRGNGAPHEHWLSIYPPGLMNHSGASMVSFGGTEIPFTSHWSTPDTGVDVRIAEIATTSGDGGRAAIWLDEDGKQQFVHVGHDTLGLITDDPLVLLQFLAMGYPEPGALQQTDITPLQSAFDYHGVYDLDEFADDEKPVPPTEFQEFLKQRFSLDMPTTARSLGIKDFPEYDDPDTKDAFSRWMTEITPPPSEAELEYYRALTRTVESLDLQDGDSSETILQKIGTLFKSKE